MEIKIEAMSQNIKNLVFQGGGVLGIAYAGALQVLEERNILQSIERTAGTSAGAIIATAVCLRYTAQEIKDIIQKTDFLKFKDGWNPLRVFTKYGLYKGDSFLKWMEQLIVNKGLPKTATFRDFKDAGCRGLHVFATDLNMKNVMEFSFDQTPDVVVAEAVRASMSIPMFFKAWQFRNSNPNNHIYVDGGIVFNYPITVFDGKEGPNAQTLGFHLDNLSGTPQANSLKTGEMYQYIITLFETILKAQVVDLNYDTAEAKRSIRIDNLGIAGTDFALTDQQKQQLFDSGVKHTADYLK